MSENPTAPTSIALHIPNYYDDVMKLPCHLGSHSAPNESFLFSLNDDQENYSTCISSASSHAQYSNQQNHEYQEHSYYSGTSVPHSSQPSPDHSLSDTQANYDSYLHPNCHNYSDFSKHPAQFGGQYNRVGQEYPHCSREVVHYSTQPNPDIQDSISLIRHAHKNVHMSHDQDFLGHKLSYKRTTRSCPNSAQISPIPSPPQRKTSTASFTCDEQLQSISIGSPDDISVTKYKRRNYTQEERRLRKKRQNLESQRRVRDKQRKEWELLKQENDKFRRELNIQALEIAEKNEQIKRLKQEIESMRLTVDIPLDEIVPTLMNF